MNTWKEEGNKRQSIAMSVYGEDDDEELAGDDWHFNVSSALLYLAIERSRRA